LLLSLQNYNTNTNLLLKYVVVLKKGNASGYTPQKGHVYNVETKTKKMH